MNDLPNARALAYDMVYNGIEVPSLSIFPDAGNPFSFFFCVSVFSLLPMMGLGQIGGGSLRIYKREVQEKVLAIVGISLEQVSPFHYVYLSTCLM